MRPNTAYVQPRPVLTAAVRGDSGRTFRRYAWPAALKSAGRSPPDVARAQKGNMNETERR
jgi:hypothetical protein